MINIQITVSSVIIIASFLLSHIVFLVHPESITAIDGTTVQFTCTVNNTNALGYFVDNVSASVSTVTQRGFMEQDAETFDTSVFRRNLTVITSAENNNNSEIYCQATKVPEFNNSNTANLIIQGIVLYDCSSIHLFVSSIMDVKY